MERMRNGVKPFTLLSMPSTSSCRCSARGYLHANCYCAIYNCNGKAVSRSTYQKHRKASEEIDISGLQRGGGHRGEATGVVESSSETSKPFCGFGIHYTNLFSLEAFQFAGLTLLGDSITHTPISLLKALDFFREGRDSGDLFLRGIAATFLRGIDKFD